MRAILVAAIAGALTAGVGYAHASLTQEAGARSAGTLSCTTRPELGLVFGTTPVANCTFIAERGGFRQSYAALMHRGTQKSGSDIVQTVTWRVTNQDGFARLGMLNGEYTTGQLVGSKAAPALVGLTARLTLLAHSAKTGAAFAADHPRIALAATSTPFSR